MNKITTYLKQGENKYYLKDRYITTTENLKIVVKNVTIYCHFKNIDVATKITLTKSNGTTSNIFEPGYWTFNLIRNHLAKNDIKLEKIEATRECKIYSENDTVNLGL